MANRLIKQDRYLGTSLRVKQAARSIYKLVKNLPITDPHTHHSAKQLLEESTWGTPYDFFLQNDHYLWRHLSSIGADLKDLGVRASNGARPKLDSHKAWQYFAEHFSALALTPSYSWTADMLYDRFGLNFELNHKSAAKAYAHLARTLSREEWKPVNLLKKENIAVLATTDGATSSLEHHKLFNSRDNSRRLIPTFRPDDVIANMGSTKWHHNIKKLSSLTNVKIRNLSDFNEALRIRRREFKACGATASDHGLNNFHTQRPLSPPRADKLFKKALNKNKISAKDQTLFDWYMLGANAFLAEQDGLTMQIHAGVWRNYDEQNFRIYGSDCGFDFPVQADLFAFNLQPILNRFGHSNRFKIVVYCLDMETIIRDLAQMAGAYPALYLGMPWWKWDSPHGIKRFLEEALPTAGWRKIAPFVSDTRSATVGVRHDLFRRVLCGWLGEKVLDGYISHKLARQIALGIIRDAPSDVFKL